MTSERQEIAAKVRTLLAKTVDKGGTDQGHCVMKPTESLAKLDLIGCWFHVFNAAGCVSRQGVVRSKIDDRRYVVQWCDWIIGALSTLSIVSVEEMTVSGVLDGTRKEGAWQFYESNEQMNFWYEHNEKKERNECR